jgi:hypothetical protein
MRQVELSKLQRLVLSRLRWAGMAGEMWANVVFAGGCFGV